MRVGESIPVLEGSDAVDLWKLGSVTVTYTRMLNPTHKVNL